MLPWRLSNTCFTYRRSQLPYPGLATAAAAAGDGEWNVRVAAGDAAASAESPSGEAQYSPMPPPPPRRCSRRFGESARSCGVGARCGRGLCFLEAGMGAMESWNGRGGGEDEKKGKAGSKGTARGGFWMRINNGNGKLANAGWLLHARRDPPAGLEEEVQSDPGGGYSSLIRGGLFSVLITRLRVGPSRPSVCFASRLASPPLLRASQRHAAGTCRAERASAIVRLACSSIWMPCGSEVLPAHMSDTRWELPVVHVSCVEGGKWGNRAATWEERYIRGKYIPLHTGVCGAQGSLKTKYC